MTNYKTKDEIFLEQKKAAFKTALISITSESLFVQLLRVMSLDVLYYFKSNILLVNEAPLIFN